jgi:hypothetical protein
MSYTKIGYYIREKVKRKLHRPNNHWWEEEYLVRWKTVMGTLLNLKSRNTATKGTIINNNNYNGLEK